VNDASDWGARVSNIRTVRAPLGEEPGREDSSRIDRFLGAMDARVTAGDEQMGWFAFEGPCGAQEETLSLGQQRARANIR